MDRAYSKDGNKLRGAHIVFHAPQSAGIRPALATVGFIDPADFRVVESLQRIELGPKLLVFRDMIRRSKFLDIWFQMVVN